MAFGHKHYHEHGGGGGDGILVGIAVVGLLFVGAISAYITVLGPLTDLLLWVFIIGYPVFAYVCSSSIAEAVRRTLLAWCWFMISGIVAGIPLLLLAEFIAGPKQEANVFTVGVCIAGIIGMGCYTLWTFGIRKT
jgi:hypothetical protein